MIWPSIIIIAVLALATLAVLWRIRPLWVLRLIGSSLFRAVCRTRVVGLENIPADGGALLAPNHQSYLDGILLFTVLRRPVRFVMSSEMYHRWFIWPFARLTRSIPIESSQSPRDLIRSIREASEEIRRGGLVCIFPEGQLSRNGAMQPFRRGIERIMKGLDAPIIPVAIDGAYDTWGGLRGGRLHFVVRLRRPIIRVAIGSPLTAGTPAPLLRRAVVELMVEAYAMRREEAVPLHRMAMGYLRRHPLERKFADHQTEEPLPCAKVAAAVVALGRALRPHWSAHNHVGVLLPPSIGAVAVNVAALLAGRVPINLNYTMSPDVVRTVCERGDIGVIITARAFVEKANLALPDGIPVVWLEDIRKGITGRDRLVALLMGLLMPIGMLERALGRTQPARIDDVATLVFSSGSTGVPKGVMLSHWNVWSNALGAVQYVELQSNACILGILPFFHSFGYTATLWLSFFRRVGVIFYPNPLDARTVGALVEKHRVTHLFATPTFLGSYIRRVEPEQFGSLTFVLTGAEKLRDSVANGFRARFGITPVEGFGASELSPVVAINALDYRAPGFYQQGSRPGTVGQPIPGVTVRVVDLETSEELLPGRAGMLLVRGTNVMQGYYKDPARTAEALRDGWYVTGDVASVDEDGFLTIRDRLARFSKIGGEMVPHIRIEETLAKIAAREETVFAVTAVPDEKKGERLVVLYALEEAEAKRCAEEIANPESGLPALWVPRWNDFVQVESIPILGSGKLDLREIKRIAQERVGVAG